MRLVATPLFARRATTLIASCLLMTFAQACSGCGEEPAPADDMSAGMQDMNVAADMSGSEDMPTPEDAGQDMEPADMRQEEDLGPPVPSCDVAFEDGSEALITADIGPWAIEVGESSGAWRVVGPGGEMSGVPSCVESDSANLPAARIARGEPTVRGNFGAFRIDAVGDHMDYSPIAGPVESVNVDEANGRVEIVWPLLEQEGKTSRLVFSLHENTQDLRIELATDLEGATGGEFSFACGNEEGFFGLGTQVTGMDLRGGTYPLWTQEQGIDKEDDYLGFPIRNILEAAYAPMGILHSSYGWSGLVTHDAFSELDLCESHDNRVTMRSYAEMPGLVLVTGETPRDRLTRITEYTGRITQPARWTFGPWSDTIGGPERIAEVTQALRDNDIPSSAIWVEDWIGGEITANGFRLSYAWEWDPGTYPNLPQDIDDLHARGFAFLAYFNTFVPEPTRMWQEGVDGGYLIESPNGGVYDFRDPAFRNASLVDLTNPEARSWLEGYLRTAANDLKIDGWMADFSEWMPEDAVLDSGESGWRYHNRFPLDWQRLNREVMESVHQDNGDRPTNDWVFWARSGWASVNGGSAGFAATMWGGDQNTDWGYDDGLPTVAPIGAHVGMAGVAIFGSDIAGYSWIGEGDILSDKELFFRWSTIGAFHPLMRTHQGAAKCLNWSFERDAETIAHYRRYASIHTLLLPYFEERARESMESGWPITRHPYLVFPEDRELWSKSSDYQYFIGDDIMVAPVMDEGATTREVYLPEAGWWPLLGDAPVESSGMMMVEAVATEIPTYMRPGRALILLGEVVDSFYGASDPDVTDLDDVEGHYRVGLYPDASGDITGELADRLTITGGGFSQTSPDWSMAQVDGAPVSACGAEPLTETCFEGDHLVLIGEQAQVMLGNASLDVQGFVGGRYDIYWAGGVFGEHAAPTPLEELDSQAPPVCTNPKGEE